MKKIKMLLSLITIAILLTSCGALYSEKYGDDWLTSTNK
jgi:PBP1b-binding outer membrane lipoprotein LpoB